MANTSKFSESDKKLLVQYLIERIRTRISGRDRVDISELTPSRILFAGVLQSVRNEKAGNTTDIPSGTAIGLDFKVRVPERQHTIRLTISVEWSVYYAVFPSFDACFRANSDGVNQDAQGMSASSPDKEEERDLVRSDDDERLDSKDAMIDNDDASSDSAKKPLARGRVILPRTWRRREIKIEGIPVELGLQNSEMQDVAIQQLGDAHIQTANLIADDPDRWRHLGEAKERQRDFGTIDVLSSPTVYANAVASVPGEPAPLPHWSSSLLVESRRDISDPETLRIKVLFANTTKASDPTVDDPQLQERALFDAKITVDTAECEVVPFDFLLVPKDYKSTSNMIAKGINCVAVVDLSNEHLLKTETLPVFGQPYYRTRELLEVPFSVLEANPIEVLNGLAVSMDQYLAEWNSFIESAGNGLLNSAEISACDSERNQFREEIERYRVGIRCLTTNQNLLTAFTLMNRAFRELSVRSGGRITSWRLFQIAFIVSQISCLAVRENDGDDSSEFLKLLRNMLDEVGVLWFPTGGGKTEAYLGLIAIALIFDRLRGKKRGVTAWMRFPLRMLSLQQLERLARVIAVLNELRSQVAELLNGDCFAMGYYVGEANTPNRIDDDQMRQYEQKPQLREAARLLRKCPHCGSQVQIEPRRSDWRLSHKCENSNCFSNTSATLGYLQGSLPIFVVDNEIYRYLPSVLVGTVDKLAIISRSKYFAHLISGPTQRCPKHGYTSYDECIEKYSGCTTKKKELHKLSDNRDSGPALLIQDELHLLRAELGVFNGHYEGLLKYLVERLSLPPKVLAATATIEAYDTHAFHIYLSKACRFPQPSWRSGESFYATSQPPLTRRFYLAVLGHTRGIEEPALRILDIYINEVRRLKTEPRRALEIMERQDLDEDDARAVLRLYDFELCYVNRKATGGSIVDKLEQVQRRLQLDNLGTIERKLLTGDQGIDEVGATLERIENELQDTDNRLDVVAATNLISHGVDLERINMMVVCGMPSHYAEYLQSTSRSARSHPGLVTVCFRSKDPREISQYEFFPVMHQHIDRLIEAVAVNRFASFAPRKTVPGILAGLLLSQWTPALYGDKIARTLDHVPTLNIALGNKPGTRETQSGCINKEELRDAIRRIIGVDRVRPPASPSQIQNLKDRVDEVFDDFMGAIARTLESQLREVLNPLTSFRDVDEGIDFGSVNSGDYAVRLRSR